MSVGKMTTPILGESLAKSFNCKFILSINELSSYDIRDNKSFIDLLHRYNINPDYYWIDKEHVEELINKVYLLIQKGYISIKEKEILTCSCGKVEIAKENINSINFKDSLFEIKDGKYYCKFCQTECVNTNERALIFN